MTDGLGPMGDLHLIAAALRADRADVESYTRVLTAVLGDALPAGMVEVERKRSLADRMGGRPGTPVSLTVTTPDEQLVLRQAAHGVHAEVCRIVRGVTIKRSTVDVDDWLVALAGVLSKLAAGSAAARETLDRLLG
ncbi:hypothetical protein ACWT_4848 [Actinoplanes sp. SE50]|uniref:hypothetical protein n=1 Tax=unclassified Actinoplanes TaxID=2626549 RepID=UPI00023EC4C3|nr:MULTISPECIES: hypothetical protein [unclassified Actinoplanes]AEV85867.1 hypothetical protein ACPL_4978 [Actinoplanes sp. SE50/110]ATO84263.1 hypothetical protein ACWT_4848 [Actinoplanes sp. SE50]SLM01673.1 hypothetical protein ACSP50_4909 [Actinoplanes sp. SE50/110]